jgi:hypothetical protein
VNRSNYRTRQASRVPGWGPAPGWGPPLPGWSPLVDHGPLPLRVAGSVARWWWPTLALAGFGVVLGFVVGHDHPNPGLSTRGLLTIILAALLALAGGLDQQPTNPTGSSANTQAKQAGTAKPKAEATQDRPGVLRIAAGAIQAVTKAIRALTGAARWVVDLWRQADQQTNRPSRSPSTTAP